MRDFVLAELSSISHHHHHHQFDQISTISESGLDDKHVGSSKHSPTQSLKHSKSKNIRSSSALMVAGSNTGGSSRNEATFTCDDLKLTPEKQIVILGISESSSSYMFKAHELLGSIDENDEDNRNTTPTSTTPNKKSLALLENCNEKLTKFESNCVSIPKTTSGQTNPLAKSTNR